MHAHQFDAVAFNAQFDLFVKIDMMTARSTAKRLLQQIGLFPVARAVFRRLSPAHRRDRQSNSRFYSAMLQSGDLCFDIGANVGQTVEALIEVRAKVVAVEPNTQCLPVLNYHFRDNPGVRIVAKAVGAVPGEAMLGFHGTDSTASLRADWPFENDQKMRVEVTTLDALIAEFGLPRFLKVDVEGFEVEVFKGLHHPVPLIYFEMHSNEMQRAAEILQLLSKIGKIEGVNAVSGDNTRWLLSEWVKPDDFVVRLGDPLPHHANVIVKMGVR